MLVATALFDATRMKRVTVSVAVLIPSKGRPDALRRLLKKQSWLNQASTFIGIEHNEAAFYQSVITGLNVTPVYYENDGGSVGRAREKLRAEAVRKGFDYYIATDDNARYKDGVLETLVRCAVEFPEQPTVSVGYHGFMKFTDRKKNLPDVRVINDIKSYRHVGTILMCIPHKIYAEYAYPHDAYALEDRHFVMWCLTKGYVNWRICMDAEFSKIRFAPGGSGSVEARQLKCGKGMARCALDFPQMMGFSGVYRAPWKELLEFATKGTNYTKRPAMGSIQKTETVARGIKGKVMIKRRRNAT